MIHLSNGGISKLMSGGVSRNIVALLTVCAVAISVMPGRVQAAPSKIPCAVDRDRLLALDQQTFDQAPTGWRELAEAGCYLEAADIIRDWRKLNATSATILPWHEGQMRANANHYRDAILLFNESRKKPSEEMAEAWNIYVDGSIAFLRADRPAFRRARARLARTARPIEFNPVDSSGKPLDLPWPPNLAVLDSLLHCWGLPYQKAYSCPRQR
jgi:hypothetical protein